MSTFAPASVFEDVPGVCTVRDVCRHLNISRMTFYRLQRQGKLPLQPVDIPGIKQPRFTGESVLACKRGRWQRSS